MNEENSEEKETIKFQDIPIWYGMSIAPGIPDDIRDEAKERLKQWKK